MNAQSIPAVVMASIAFYAGLYRLLIYLRQKRHREDMTFALLCLATGFYDVFCAGLYNASSVAEGAQWQRMQFIALAFLTTVFLWFVSDYTRQKPGIVIHAFSAFYLLAVLIQIVDRSRLTWLVDQPAVKNILLPLGLRAIYYEATLGPFTAFQGFVGMAASTYILWVGVLFYRRGYRREAVPLLLALSLMYAAAINDTLVSNNVYQFVYTIEYGYMAMILLMAYSLSSTVVQSAMTKESLRASEERFRSLVETTSDWVWEISPKGVYTYASPKVHELLGYEPKEIIGKALFDLMLPDEAERIGAVFRGIVNSRSPIERVENTVRHKDGRLVVLETSGAPFFDPNGRFAGYRGIDRDITGRRQADEALRESAERYRLIANAAMDGFVVVDLSGRFLDMNEAYCRMIGYRRDELLEMSIPDIEAADKPDEVKARIQRITKTGSDRFESRHRRKDGCVIDVEVSLTFMRQTGHSLVFLRDITERKQTAEALLREKIFSDTVLDSIQMTFFLFTAQGELIRWNARYLEQAGLAAEEAKSMQVIDFILEQDRPAVLKAVQKVFAEGRCEVEAHGISRDKTITFYHFAASRMIIDDQAYLLGAGIDITERKRAEEALRESEKRYRSVIENIQDVFYRSDTQGRLLMGSPSGARMFGYATIDDMIGLPLDSFWLDPQDRKRGLTQMKTTGSIKDYEGVFKRRDGATFDASFSAHFYYDEHGDLLGTEGIIRDITERKQAESEREALIAELEAKNAELERFTYTVSHDLKSPLITIGSFVGFLEQDALAGNMERIKTDIAYINDATASMQRLLNELLELSRIGRLTNPPEEVSFEDIAREAVELVRGRIMVRGVEVEIAPGLPTVYGDRTRLVEVVQNLVDNACKFAGDQPYPRVEIGVRQDGNEPVFYVRDNGIGIEPRYHAQVFDLFDKLDPQSEGTGVGLALVKRIVEVHDGKIWVESEGSGKGSTFCFTLAHAPSKNAAVNQTVVN